MRLLRKDLIAFAERAFELVAEWEKVYWKKVVLGMGKDTKINSEKW